MRVSSRMSPSCGSAAISAVLTRQWGWIPRKPVSSDSRNSKGWRGRRTGDRRAAQGCREGARPALSEPSHLPSAAIFAGSCQGRYATKAAIFANSPVVVMEELPEGGVRVSTENGGLIEAGSAVVATNSPVNDRFQLHTKMSPIACDGLYAAAWRSAGCALLGYRRSLSLRPNESWPRHGRLSDRRWRRSQVR